MSFPSTVDSIHASLFAPSEYDAVVEEFLYVLFSAFSSLLLRLVEDHLPGGKFDNADGTLVTDTTSVPKTNTVSERDFAQLDHLLREKPNASILSLEAMILFNNNKTAKWLNIEWEIWSWTVEIALESQSLWTRIEKSVSSSQKATLEEHADILQAKQAALMRLQEKKLLEKEKLTQTIWNMAYGKMSSKCRQVRWS